ncbi:CLUMA_CG013037, isoform A [Clunio marinus]|uniref:CLUMA_CG013037, isoform A n=1 Tax=Clunio marinus TaxID=568069 RepID=A0A1J1IKT0_9DIPT|nr:CLUMA_CG013037, isoform A [Clunio marinus]
MYTERFVERCCENLAKPELRDNNKFSRHAYRNLGNENILSNKKMLLEGFWLSALTTNLFKRKKKDEKNFS